MLNKGNTFKNYGGENSSKKSPKSSSKSYNTKSYKEPSEPVQLSETQEKIMKILGVFLFILSFAFTIAFVSYLFTWEEDQSYISKSNGSWSTLFSTAEEIDNDAIDLPVVQNKLGKFGALLANQFIYEWFGIASFIFIFILFVTGYRLLYRKNILPVGKSILYSSIAIIYVSVTLGFLQSFIAKTPHILEGKFGFWTNRLLEAQIGSAGVAGIVVFAYLTVLILIYNLDLKFTFQSKKKIYDEDLAFDTDDVENNPVNNSKKTRILKDEEYVIDPIDLNDKAPVQEFNQFREPEETYNNNVRREEPTLSIEEEPEVVPNSTPHISFTIDHPDAEEEEMEEDIPASPVLRVEKVIEEKPITANDLVAQFGEYDPKLDLSGYQYPPLELLKDYGSGKITINQQELEANKNKIVDTLRNYSIEIEHIKATIGPTVTLYEIIPKPGVRISKIKNLEDDIALSLAALGIRIIAPMPGKGTIGIEVPNSTPEMVSMRSVLATEKFQKTDMDLPIALGKTISNEVYIADLAKMPHLLVAGATGQGKSVGINAILTSLLYKKHPAELKFVLVDPKKVELSLFKKIERHFLAKLPGEDDAIITDTKKVINTLNSLCIEMDQRYDLLKNGQVRNLKEYNAKFVNRRLNPEEGHRFLPFIVLIVDEFADLMMTAGKEVETPIARLAQLARAVGIHLVIATQRPSVNIITGTIKANFPARLAFRVLSKVDSRTILDSGGADQLIGRGDMLLSTGSDLIRIQCAFVDTPEVDQISDYIGGQRGYPSAFMLPEYIDENGEGSGLADFDMDDRDQLFEDAARLIVMHQQGSTSLIQRKLKLGYNRAGRIIDQLEAAGIVGPFEGSKAREVLYPDEYSLEQYLETLRKDN
ncbi:DNA translocase FtsK 4TM domain-containing protein [Sphingobacterium spiritivorum]|uniref:FtsK/SpoIIIE family protein n=1 Tax=Sphingobacterium spiritivorum ATCC 33861 TaxID=525373 RepID=D7VMU5_SPHSI|nr:DNA translocase FtsK [Sphingobacterium spiritivorum]EFK57242.1 FtsK/SpoIIIE family protein [Sphingobacterium spiritivorum ATCC 33861]QQT36671.1 DNA translocase FtsK [Sphingobacterium spiritivorum]WQD33423.1 DNA translocase FtsK [Sphingobacterium spiritivorum]SUJ23305.1 Stage III sporulation protein E [Sphingobacterium spiritivorum]